MATIVLTVFEATADEAVAAIRASEDQVDAFEVRVDRLDSQAARHVGPALIRRASRKPMIYTRRSSGARSLLTEGEIEAALMAGFDFVDVELRPGCEVLLRAAGRGRTILSHHDFDGMGDLDALLESMAKFGSAKRKIAVTPRSLAENLAILELLERSEDPALTVLGMGARGLYSRILAPFFGSDLVFTSKDPRSNAAPGQIDLERTLEIYGEPPVTITRPGSIFAVVGNPASHSRSPGIHNPIFRQEKLAAAYSIAECDRLAPVVDSMLGANPLAPRGISITAPFKREAFEMASSRGWVLGKNAAVCRSVNTLVRFDGDDGILRAYNTDVEGFEAAFELARKSSRVAVIGAGGTARAAVAAAKSRKFDVTVYNRSRENATSIAVDLDAESEDLAALERFRGDVVVNTLTAGADFRLPDAIFRKGGLFVDVGYAEGTTTWAERAADAGMTVFDGFDLLVAQAVEQSRLFLGAASGERMREPQR